MENKSYKIIDFCMTFDLANIENDVVVMPNYEDGKQIIMLLVRCGNESYGEIFTHIYKDKLNISIQEYARIPWKVEDKIYTMLKFEEKI